MDVNLIFKFKIDQFLFPNSNAFSNFCAKTFCIFGIFNKQKNTKQIFFRGTFAVVYLLKDRQTGELLALKVINKVFYFIILLKKLCLKFFDCEYVLGFRILISNSVDV